MIILYTSVINILSVLMWVFIVKENCSCSVSNGPLAHRRHPVGVILLLSMYTRQITHRCINILMRHVYIHTRARAIPIVRYNSALTIILLYSRGRATHRRLSVPLFLHAVPAVIISRAFSASHSYPPPITHPVPIHDREYLTNTIHPLQCATIYIYRRHLDTILHKLLSRR